MGKKTICTPNVIINNVVWPIVPNTLTYTEGIGEYTMRSSSIGGGLTEVVFSEDASKKMSKVSFEMYPLDENIEKIKEWKLKRNDNVIEFADTITRVFTNCALINDYEIKVGADTTISLEFMGDPAV